MVWKVKKVLVVVFVLVLICTFGATVQAQTYTPYEGNISTSNLTYFEDIISKVSILKDYVLIRNGQYEYSLIVGDLEYSNNKFTANGSCDVYKLNTGSNYNSYYTYSKTTDSSAVINTNSILVYSNLGDFPELENRGDKFEILQTVIIGTLCVGIVIRSIFRSR